MRKAILQSVGDDDASLLLLRSTIPSIHSILGLADEASASKGKCPNNPICGANIKSKESLQRFTFVLTSFLQAICTPEQPLVLLLDDLHYADPCSLDILASVMSTTPGLFLVGTCDDSDMSNKSYLARKLREIEDHAGVSLVHVNVENLKEEEVCSLLQTTLDRPMDDEVAALAKFVYERTLGNLSFILSVLYWLVKMELLDRQSVAEQWTWDLDEIRVILSPESVDVVEFISMRFLEELPCDLKETLKVAACLGSHISARLVEHAIGTNALQCLQEARERGILNGDDVTGIYSFIHENVQMAAYRLIPEADLALYHLEIGRRIWRNIPPCGVHRLFFVILAQMQHGRHLITRQRECLAVANLCLSAGTAAVRTSSFRTAAIYLEFGILMLQNRSWRDEYDLTLSLYNFAAEVHMSTANFERMDTLVDDILANGRRLLDKIPAYCTRIYALSVQGQGEQAIFTGIDVLAGLGEKFPARLCSFQLHKLYCKVLKQLKGKSDEVILRLPTITDSEKLACLQVLHLIFITALLARPSFTPYIVLTMMDITLRNGLSAFSSMGFAYFGMICLQYTNDAKTAFRYGLLSLTLLDRFQAEEFIPRVHCAFYGCIYPRRKPIQDTLEHLWNAHLVGMRTGDVNAAFICASLWMMNAFESNVPLPLIERRMKKCRELMKLYRQTAQIAIVQPHMNTIDYLMGFTQDNSFDLADDNLFQQESVMTEFNIPFTNIQRTFFFNEFENVKAVQKAITRRSHLVPPSFKIIAITFMAGLAALVEARRGMDARKNKRFAKKVIAKFRDTYSVNSPHNCLGMQFLLEAELAAVRGDNERARSSYAAAIAMAEANELLYMRGQAYERTARHLFTLGERNEAFDYFIKTIEAYTKWGAHRKVQALELQLELDYKISRPCFSPPSSDDYTSP
jgi:predicted ATPase